MRARRTTLLLLLLTATPSLADPGYRPGSRTNLLDDGGPRAAISPSKKLGRQFEIASGFLEYTGCSSPAAAGLSNGAFAVTYQCWDSDYPGSDVEGQIFTNPKHARYFSIDPGNRQDQTAIAELEGGRFAVSYTSSSKATSDNIFVSRSTNQGAKLGSSSRVNTTTADLQTNSSIAGVTGGGFVVVWRSHGEDRHHDRIYGQRYGANGVMLGKQFQVNERPAKYYVVPAVAGLRNGKFVVVWNHGGQIFNERNKPVGDVFIFTEGDVPKYQIDPSVATLAGGGFVITWQRSGGIVMARRFNAAGSPIGGQFQVNSNPYGYTPSAVGLTSGGFVISWTSYDGDGGIFARQYDGKGHAVGDEFQVDTPYYYNSFGSSKVAALSDDRFVVVWDVTDDDYQTTGVYGQLFGP
jgi:hypothetical protein